MIATAFVLAFCPPLFNILKLDLGVMVVVVVVSKAKQSKESTLQCRSSSNRKENATWAQRGNCSPGEIAATKLRLLGKCFICFLARLLQDKTVP